MNLTTANMIKARLNIKSISDHGSSKAFRFPAEVDGWLSPEEGEALYEAAAVAGGLCVELGAYKGRSTICLAQGADQVITVDHGEGEPGRIDGGYTAALGVNLHGYPNVTLWLGRTDDPKVARDVTGTTRRIEIAMLFVDADHDNAVHDWLNWIPHMAARSTVAFHDSNTGDVPDAIKLARDAGWSDVIEVGALTITRRPPMV